MSMPCVQRLLQPARPSVPRLPWLLIGASFAAASACVCFQTSSSRADGLIVGSIEIDTAIPQRYSTGGDELRHGAADLLEVRLVLGPVGEDFIGLRLLLRLDVGLQSTHLLCEILLRLVQLFCRSVMYCWSAGGISPA